MPRFGRFNGLGLPILFIMVSFLARNVGAETPPAHVHLWVWEHTADGKSAEFFVVLGEQADLAVAEELRTKEEKGWFVYETLSETADRTQAPLRQWLTERKIKFQPFFIVNAILVTGGRDLVLELANRWDVDRIEGNPRIKNDLPKPESNPDPDLDPDIHEAEPEPEAITAIEWGVQRTNAPGVWTQGFFGQGIVVGAQDTGYRWTHNFIKGKYRGWNGVTGDHNYNWHDSIHSGGGICGFDSLVPCDDDGHGTHTIGTVLGDDGLGNQVGMAPQAKWIGCRNMDVGFGTPATYLECFQFFLAPTRLDGTGADPTRAPDVTTNSWGCPPVEGCSWSTLQAAVDAQKAAGIMTVVAAGNSGSACQTVDDPPAVYGSAYCIGATTSADGLASFSSRGPALGTNLMKPNIVAPGVGVRSGTNTSDTATMTISGTSMATPHVAGGVALLWSARPSYKKQQDATETLLNCSARRLPAIVEGCGGNYVIGPNNSWGYGLLDILAAVNAVPGAVSATTNSCANVSVTWTNGAGATSHNVLRYTGACPSAVGLVTFTGVTSPYTDTTAAAGSSYCYVVQAQSACGARNSIGVTGTRLATPTTPAAATAAGTCAGVNVSWTAVPLATSYNVLRTTTSCSGLATLATGVAGTAYSDATAVVGTTYFYAVQAVNACGASPTGACGAGAARLATPAIPTVIGPASGCGSVILSTQLYTAYQWYLGAAPIAGATSQSYTATASGTYSVVVFGANGCSAPSAGTAVTITPGSQTFHLQVQATFVAGYKDMQNATAFEGTVQQQATAGITAAGQYQIGSTPLQWISPAYTKVTDLASSPWTFDVYGLTTNTGAAGQLYARVLRYNAGAPVLLFTTGFATPDISTAVTQTRFTWNHTPAAGTTISTGDRLIVEIWINATSGSSGTPTTATDFVNADVVTNAGTITAGSFASTQACDATVENLRETTAPGTLLDHVWSIPLTTGSAHTFNAVAATDDAVEQIALEWGTSSTGPWTTMFSVRQSSSLPCATPQTFALPGALTGTIYIHAITVAPGGASGRDRLFVDYMAVVTTVPGAPPFFTLNYDFATADSLVTAADCLGVVVAAAKPVPDGNFIPGTPMTAAKNGTDVTVTFDTTSCTAVNYNIYWAPIGTYTGTYTGGFCAIGTTGSWTGAIPNNVWWGVAGTDGAGVVSTVSKQTSGTETPTTGWAAVCPVQTAQNTALTCP